MPPPTDSGLRRQPFRVLFPLGIALAWAGVFHWIPYAIERGPYRPLFHSVVQIQAFLTCFAVGFLMTAVPRRTGTAPPAAWQLALACAAPIATAVAAWLGAQAIAQLAWLALAALLFAFCAARFRSGAPRRPPDGFLWIPFALLLGVVGAVALGVYDAFGIGGGFYALGRLLVLQGLFAGLVFGAGGLALPLMTRGDAPPDGGPGLTAPRALHALAAAALVASFWLEAEGWRGLGLALRGLVALAVLVVGCRIWRPPTKPGTQRWSIWLSAWAIPCGYALAAVDPSLHHVGLHVVFMSGFALMALSVGIHVTLAHGPRAERAHARSPAVAVLALAVVAATALRALADLDPSRRPAWLGAAAAVFLAATLVWLAIAAATWRGSS